MTGGYMGKMLFVDLSQGKTWDEPLEENLCRDFIGGYGIGAKLIFERQPPKADPLGPDAILGFVTGPLTGTPAIIGSRYVVMGKSPLTETWGDANSGGDFGPHLKFAGFDAVFFRGISDRPVYLYIDDGKAELRGADHLWGKDSHETEDMLQAELGKETRVACIGPSGERISLISCVINNKGRAAARSGLGAVMGAKKLKAIALNGNQAVPLARKPQLQEMRKKYLEQLSRSALGQRLREGTGSGIVLIVKIGDAPVKNWNVAGIDAFPNAGAISGESLDAFREKRYACWRCPIGCGATMNVGVGEYKYPAGAHRPEYETLASFGTMCLNDNLESVIMANDICNRYGLDTISTGATIAFAIECYENGLITDKDTDGIQLTWGNHQAIVAMTQKLARREGFGDILADGVKVAAEKIGKGAEGFAIHIHGQEVPMHDPKAQVGWTMAYLGASPGRHTQAYEVLMPPSGLELPPYEPESCAGRGEAHRIASNLGHVMQCAGVCMFGYLSLEANSLAQFLNLVTGSNYSLDDLLKIGERIANIRQAFNIREGISISDFEVPNRVLGHPPLPAGPTAGKQVDIGTLRRDYLMAMDWDLDSGKPSKEKLLELGLKNAAEALWPPSLGGQHGETGG